MSQELVVNNFLKNIHPKNSNPYIYFSNSIYPTIYPYLEKSRDIYNNITNKITSYYTFLTDVKDTYIELKRLNEYEQLRVDYYERELGSKIMIYDKEIEDK
jgi:hypothetical protein